MSAATAIKQYQQVSVNSSVMGASPHSLIQMLMEGVLEQVALAGAGMARNEVAEKGHRISRAITILGGLKGSLNKEAGGEVAENLNDLYDYMLNRLVIANIRNDQSILNEVSGLMLEIKKGWDAMPEAYKH